VIQVKLCWLSGYCVRLWLGGTVLCSRERLYSHRTITLLYNYTAIDWIVPSVHPVYCCKLYVKRLVSGLLILFREIWKREYRSVSDGDL